MQKLICLALLLAFGIGAQADERIKDGRQYTLELARRLQLDSATTYELMKLFRESEGNLPKSSSPSLLAGALTTLAKIANQGCAYASFFQSDFRDVNGLYAQVLGRPATSEEVREAVKGKDGKPKFLPNCMVVALHPEFIYQK